MNTVKSIQKQLLLILVSAVYLLLFSAYTSPLFPKFLNYDSAIFMMVGKGILAGKELYVDIFDHKGPILFWLEAIGITGGRLGIFFLQTVFLWVDLLLVDRMTGLFLKGAAAGQTGMIGRKHAAKRWSVIGITLLMLSYPLANGNLSEEYSLPFILLPLYLFLKDYLEQGKPVLRNSYVYGLCFGILAFIRLNNAVTLAAIVLYWMIVLIMKRDGLKLLRHIGIGLLGLLTAVAPTVMWFALRGSLYDMIYASFLFNFRYSSHMSFLQTLTNLNVLAHMAILFTPLLLAMLVFAVKIRDGKLTAALELIMVVNILSLFMGHGYNHYFTITVPLDALMGICMLYSEGRICGGTDNVEKRQAGRSNVLLWIGFFGVLAVYGILAARIVILNVRDYYIEKTVTKEYETVWACLDQIPEEERAYVLGYNIPAKYYLMGDILPCFRYGILQENWSRSDPDIMDETIRFLKEKNVRWVMTEAGCDNPEVLNVLEEYYDLVEETDYGNLYRRR